MLIFLQMDPTDSFGFLGRSAPGEPPVFKIKTKRQTPGQFRGINGVKNQMTSDRKVNKSWEWDYKCIQLLPRSLIKMGRIKQSRK